MKFYTWKDIDRYVLMHRKDWENTLNNIEVYPDEIIAYPKECSVDLAHSALLNLFPKNVLSDYSALKLDCPNAFFIYFHVIFEAAIFAKYNAPV